MTTLAESSLTFNPPVPDAFPPLRPAAPPPPAEGTRTKDDMLRSACGGDEKCVCINRAIFVHDSGFATAGVGKRARNPCNMRRPGSWAPDGIVGETGGAVGKFLVFDSLESGITACVQVYQRFYTDKTADQLVSAWTAGGGNAQYRSAVRSCFNS